MYYVWLVLYIPTLLVCIPTSTVLTFRNDKYNVSTLLHEINRSGLFNAGHKFTRILIIADGRGESPKVYLD